MICRVAVERASSAKRSHSSASLKHSSDESMFICPVYQCQGTTCHKVTGRSPTALALQLQFFRSPHRARCAFRRHRFPNSRSQMKPGTAYDGSAFSQYMPSDRRQSGLVPKGQGIRCIVAHGCRQPPRTDPRIDHSGDLGRRFYELQCGVARAEPPAGAATSRREAVVPDDCRPVANASGTDRTHLYPASTRAPLTAATCLS